MTNNQMHSGNLNGQWLTDWNTFADTIQHRIKVDGSIELLAEEICGKQVAWAGVLYKVNDDPDVLTVTFVMNNKNNDVGNSRTARLMVLTMSMADGSIQYWKSRAVGEEVHFSANFPVRPYPFAAIELSHLKGGPSLITVRLVDAMPISM